MNLTEELNALIKEPMRDEDVLHDRVFWRLVDIYLEMAKRIEALEQGCVTVQISNEYGICGIDLKYPNEQDIIL